MKSDLLLTLQIVARLETMGVLGAADLCVWFGLSVATLKRRLADARHLGAVIESSRAESGAWVYRLCNPRAVRERLYQWLELESARSLV